MSRTDQVIAAVTQKLEDMRQSLDVDLSVRKMDIDVFFNDGGNVRNAKVSRSTDDELPRKVRNN